MFPDLLLCFRNRVNFSSFFSSTLKTCTAAESRLLRLFDSPHSGCTSYFNDATAHMEAATSHTEDATLHIEFVIAHIAPVLDHI